MVTPWTSVRRTTRRAEPRDPVVGPTDGRVGKGKGAVQQLREVSVVSRGDYGVCI